MVARNYTPLCVVAAGLCTRELTPRASCRCADQSVMTFFRPRSPSNHQTGFPSPNHFRLTLRKRANHVDVACRSPQTMAGHRWRLLELPRIVVGCWICQGMPSAHQSIGGVSGRMRKYWGRNVRGEAENIGSSCEQLDCTFASRIKQIDVRTLLSGARYSKTLISSQFLRECR